MPESSPSSNSFSRLSQATEPKWGFAMSDYPKRGKQPTNYSVPPIVRAPGGALGRSGKTRTDLLSDRRLLRVPGSPDMLPVPSDGFPLYRRWSVLWGLASGTALEYRALQSRSQAPPAPLKPTHGTYTARPPDEPSHTAEEPEPHASVSTFLVDSLFLEESRKICCRQTQPFREEFHYATGFQITDRVFVISHILKVEFQEQSPVGVSVDDRSNIQCFQKLEQVGLPLVAHFHSHPGTGPGANHPSQTDRAFRSGSNGAER